MKEEIKERVIKKTKIPKTIAWLTLFASLVTTAPGCSYYNKFIDNLNESNLESLDDEAKNEMDLILKLVEDHFISQGYDDLGEKTIEEYITDYKYSHIKEDLNGLSKKGLKYMLAYQPVVIIPEGVENIYDDTGETIDIGTGIYPDGDWFTSMLSLKELYPTLDFRGMATLVYDKGAFIFINDNVYLVYWENTLIDRKSNEENNPPRIRSDVNQGEKILFGKSDEGINFPFSANREKGKTLSKRFV